MSAVRWRLSIVVSVLVSLPLSAQDSRVVTFDDAIEIALERNSDLLTVRADAAIGDVTVSEAQMRFLPDLRMEADGGRIYGRRYDAQEGSSARATESAAVDLVTDINLFNGFRDLAALRRARFARNAGVFDLNHAEQTIVFTVAANFLTLLQSREQLRVSRENLVAEIGLEQQIKDYVEAGSREVAVLYQQEANVAAARLAVVQGKNIAQSDEIDLLRTLQLDADGAYDFQLPKLLTEAADEPPDRGDLLERAAAQRVDLKAQEARVAAAEQSIGIARSAFWPTLSLSARYGGDYSSLQSPSFNDQLNARRGGVVGVLVTMPIFDRAAANNSVRRARLEVLKARIASDAAREEVGLLVRKVHQDYVAAREEVFAAEAQSQAAERAMQTAEERFKAGVTTLVEVTQARARDVDAAQALVDARSNMQFQRIRIEYAVGGFDRSKFTTK
jgi:outer membrane protein